MKNYLLKKEIQQKLATSNPSKKHQSAVFEDNRPSNAIQMKLQKSADESPQVQTAKAMQSLADNRAAEGVFQKKENKTGLPDGLKSGIEHLSGYAMDDVNVHYNSSKPAQLQAHAYAQGTDIHVASGQEQHVAHEAWHVVQQKQGRVKPTMQMKGKVNVNDDKGLEKEADIMGAKALQMKSQLNDTAAIGLETKALQMKKSADSPLQRQEDGAAGDAITVKVHPTKELEIYLKANEIAYHDVKAKKWLKGKEIEFMVTKAQHEELINKGLIQSKEDGPVSSGPDSAS